MELNPIDVRVLVTNVGPRRTAAEFARVPVAGDRLVVFGVRLKVARVSMTDGSIAAEAECLVDLDGSLDGRDHYDWSKWERW